MTCRGFLSGCGVVKVNQGIVNLFGGIEWESLCDGLDVHDYFSAFSSVFSLLETSFLVLLLLMLVFLQLRCVQLVTSLGQRRLFV